MSKTTVAKAIDGPLDKSGGLITFKAGSATHCLGYLITSPDGDVYDATYGRVNVSPEEMVVHNQLLDAAVLQGLDERCQVGQGGFFYLTGDSDRPKVVTFMGTLVSDDVRLSGDVRRPVVRFRRKGKVFSGKMDEGATSFNFVRVQ